jgi:hypothetical protein
MSSPQSRDVVDVPGARIQRAEQVCDRFEAAWKAGARPCIEEHLAAVPEPERAALLRELILLEIDYRRLAGEQPAAEEFLARFPTAHVWIVDMLSLAVPTTRLQPGEDVIEVRGPGQVGAAVAVPGYEILQEVGRGGMGVVYKARHLALKRVVALKMIRAGGEAGPEEVARFKAEAEAVARLQHPHIVQIHEVGEVEGHPFCALEFVAGGSLTTKLAGTPQPPRQAAQWVQTLAGAIQAAHEAGILHRDLKPANVLLTEDGQPKVTDFGLAKRLDDPSGPTQTGAVLGTPSYMAPEQAAGQTRALGPAADVYALGVILYECLTGRPPFRAATVLDTLWQVRTEEPIPPSRFQPHTPRDLETICLKCLQKDPHRRYPSARALADDLGRYLRGEPIAAKAVGPGGRLLKWARRRPAVAGLLAAVLVVLVAGSAVSAYFAISASISEGHARAGERLAKEKAAALEVAVARGWLRPMGHEGAAVTPQALDALWELAGSPDERPRQLFVEEALARPETADQLHRGAELAVHAAVGLSPQRRRQVLDLVLRKLRDPDADLRTRAACVSVGIALRAGEEEFARLATATVLRQIAGATGPDGLTRLAAVPILQATHRSSDPSDLVNIAGALNAVADRLPREEAGRAAVAAARHLLQGLAKKTNHGESVVVLAGALEVVAGRLDRDGAAAVAGPLLQEITKTTHPIPLPYLARALAVLAEKLGREEAGQAAAVAARHTLRQMTGTTDPFVLQTLARALRAVAGKLSREEAGRAAAAASQHILRQLATTTTPAELGNLAAALEAVADRLDQEEAGTAVRQVLQKLTTTTDLGARSGLVLVFQAAAGKLSREDIARTTQQLLAQTTRTTNPVALIALVGALREGMDRIPREEAEKAAAVAAQHVLRQITGTTEPVMLVFLARLLPVVTAKLGPEEAGKLTAAAARHILRQVAATTEPSALALLIRALQAAADTAGREEAGSAAAKVAPQLLAQLVKTTDSFQGRFALETIAAALRAAADKLGRQDAGPVVVAAQHVLEKLALTTDLGELRYLERTARPGDRKDKELVGAFRVLVEKLDEQAVVALLKQPACIGPARETLLRELGNRGHRTFADLWEFVDWAREHRPDLDLDTPPRRLPLESLSTPGEVQRR